MDARSPDPDVPPVEVEMLLRDLAVRGLGTVLGVEALDGRSGVRRVSRAGPVADGDRLADLFREHRESMLTYARRHAVGVGAEDVVQRAFEKVWKRRPALDELDNPQAYLVTAVRNEVHRDLRRTITHRERTVADGAAGLEQYRAPTDVSGQVSDRMTIRAELGRLPAREREAVVLRMQWQLSVEETAEIMGISTGAVKGYTHHGLRKLRDGLERR